MRAPRRRFAELSAAPYPLLTPPVLPATAGLHSPTLVDHERRSIASSAARNDDLLAIHLRAHRRCGAKRDAQRRRTGDGAYAAGRAQIEHQPLAFAIIDFGPGGLAELQAQLNALRLVLRARRDVRRIGCGDAGSCNLR